MHEFSRWKARLQGAQRVEEVEEVVRQYLAAIQPADYERLPPKVRELLDDSPHANVVEMAVLLVKEELRFTGDEQAAHLLQEISHTFVAASNRLGQLS